MNKNINRLLFPIAIFAAVIIWYGCKKTYDVSIPEEQAHFTNKQSDVYFVTSPSATYKVPIGVTTVSSTERVVNFTVTSKTAVQGTDYTLSKSQAVIGAGKAIDSIEVKVVNPANYTPITKRRDTLTFVIVKEVAGKSSGVSPSTYNDTFRLIIRPGCIYPDDLATDIKDLEGDYANTMEDFSGAYGPYTTKIKNISYTPGATNAIITVENIYDAGWGDINFVLDWSNPGTPTTTVVTNNNVAPGSTISSTYAAYRVAVTQHPSAPTGTFDFCSQKLTLKMAVGYATTAGVPIGYYGFVYTVTMQR